MRSSVDLEWAKASATLRTPTSSSSSTSSLETALETLLERYAPTIRANGFFGATPGVDDVQALYAHDLDAFQKDASRAVLLDGDSVVVSAPTGSGKTLVGETAIVAALARGQKAIYTTPLKALSNQKLREFQAKFGVGGDGPENRRRRRENRRRRRRGGDDHGDFAEHAVPGRGERLETQDVLEFHRRDARHNRSPPR